MDPLNMVMKLRANLYRQFLNIILFKYIVDSQAFFSFGLRFRIPLTAKKPASCLLHYTSTQFHDTRSIIVGSRVR